MGALRKWVFGVGMTRVKERRQGPREDQTRPTSYYKHFQTHPPACCPYLLTMSATLASKRPKTWWHSACSLPGPFAVIFGAWSPSGPTLALAAPLCRRRLVVLRCGVALCVVCVCVGWDVNLSVKAWAVEKITSRLRQRTNACLLQCAKKAKKQARASTHISAPWPSLHYTPCPQVDDEAVLSWHKFSTAGLTRHGNRIRPTLNIHTPFPSLPNSPLHTGRPHNTKPQETHNDANDYTTMTTSRRRQRTGPMPCACLGKPRTTVAAVMLLCLLSSSKVRLVNEC